jgi:hypothetical protein
MKQGDALVYHWKLEKGIVYTDFHADPGENAAGYPERYYIRYAESEVGENSGSLIAPLADAFVSVLAPLFVMAQ